LGYSIISRINKAKHKLVTEVFLKQRYYDLLQKGAEILFLLQWRIIRTSFVNGAMFDCSRKDSAHVFEYEESGLDGFDHFCIPVD